MSSTTSPKTSSSTHFKKTSLIYVCKLTKLRNGKYIVKEVDGAEQKHERFMWRFFSTLNHTTTHSSSGVDKNTLRELLQRLYPNGQYRLYYSHIISVRMAPKRLF